MVCKYCSSLQNLLKTNHVTEKQKTTYATVTELLWTISVEQNYQKETEKKRFLLKQNMSKAYSLDCIPKCTLASEVHNVSCH